MKLKNNTIDKSLTDTLAEVKALRYALIHKAIDYNQAKTKADELLQVVNKAGEKIAKKYGRTYRKIRFSDL